MKIEIITTGDEVMQGTIVDTNTAWIAERLVPLGHEIVRHTSVGDDMMAISDALTQAAARDDAVFVTGGLGPTADDITIEAASRAFEIPLVRDDTVLDGIRRFFEKIGREMSPSNEKQALVPEGARILANTVGTAPGVQVHMGGADFFFLPGVPKELYQIFDDSIIPWLRERSGLRFAKRVLRCFGLPEASIDEKLSRVDLAGARLSFRVKFPEVLLTVVARSKDEVEAQTQVDAAANAIKETLGDAVYGEGETPLAEVVGRLLKARGMKLAVAESCTGGLLCSTITDVAGASEYFECGAITYSNASKESMLGVSAEILSSYGAVSKETVSAMAEGMRRESEADIAVAITGIAGPGGGSAAKPVGTVHIGLATLKNTWTHEFQYARDRLWFKQLVAATALDLVRKYLMKLDAS
jgi:nicotinamide-nucleotide amidase